MSVVWEKRTTEEQGLLNPPFMALLLERAVDGFRVEAGTGLPFPYAFLIVPLVLQPESRRNLPQVVTTSLAAWLPQHALEREMLAIRVRGLKEHVREGLFWGLQADLFRIEAAALVAGMQPKTRRFTSTTDFDDCLKKARFLGRWFARSGPVPTVLAMWGVRP